MIKNSPTPLWCSLAWLTPATLFAVVAFMPAGPWSLRLDWVPLLGVGFALHIDGLSRLFLYLILGIGTAVMAYAPAYLHGDARLPRLMLLLLAFMASMVGAVVADDLLLFFLFWEATSVVSFLLVGFDNVRSESRESARQALLITGGGGLVLLAGFVLIHQAAPGLRLSDLPGLGPALVADPFFTAGVVLVLIGGMTKSAQFPFHYWLPGAMAAPTPVSAYLHSATMVKLGVYLLARFDEAMGAVLWWEVSLTAIGLLTAVTGAVLSLRERDLKRILAWTTVSALGTLTLIIGLPNELGALAFAAFMLAHALYKAPLFFVAGNIDHAAHTRIIDRLRGLAPQLPLTAAAALLAGLSMAGLPASFGFVAKDLILIVKDSSDTWLLVSVGSLLVSAVGVAVAAVASLRVFFGGPRTVLPASDHGHEPLRLGLTPLLVASLGLAFGLMPWLVEDVLVEAARTISPALGTQEVTLPSLDLTRQASVALVLGLGALTYVFWDRIKDGIERLTWLDRFGPEAHYHVGLRLLKKLAGAVSRRLQHGVSGDYLGVTVLVLSVLVLASVVRSSGADPLSGAIAFGTPSAADLGFMLGCVTAIVGAGLALQARDTLARLLSAGLVGLACAAIFLFRGAPDLAFTQLSVETVFVIVAAVALRRHVSLDPAPAMPRWRVLTAVVFGLTLGLLMLLLLMTPFDDSLSRYFLENSKPLAHGQNVVNVIIVDFRALDTLGEIAVVMLAALAAWPLLSQLSRRRR